MIRTLRRDETAGPGFAHLMWLATEAGEQELGRILREELPGLSVIGVVEGNRVVAFAALDPGVDPTVIEYIAVEEASQGRGHGGALVDAARDAGSSRAVYAETDDDAVDFYRRLGFTVTGKAPDPRWPERQRYACLLG
jgi:ribosomal protein S18 acetylase RimI-like enzyme